MNAPVFVAASLDFGRDMWGIPADNITESLKWLYVAYFTYMLAEALCQMSILAFYLHITVEPRLRTVVWIMLAVVACFGIANMFAMIFQCTPIPFFWDGWRGEMTGFCGVDVRLCVFPHTSFDNLLNDVFRFGFARGELEIFLNLVILTLPLPMLAMLNMSLKKKLQIMSVFCVGFVITVVSCLRLWFFVQFANTTNPTCKKVDRIQGAGANTHVDDNVSGLYWCATESNLFTVVACMPALHAIFHKLLRKVRGISTYGSRGQYGSEGPSKRSYLHHNTDQRKNSIPSGAIKMATDVTIERNDRAPTWSWWTTEGRDNAGHCDFTAGTILCQSQREDRAISRGGQASCVCASCPSHWELNKASSEAEAATRTHDVMTTMSMIGPHPNRPLQYNPKLCMCNHYHVSTSSLCGYDTACTQSC